MRIQARQAVLLGVALLALASSAWPQSGLTLGGSNAPLNFIGTGNGPISVELAAGSLTFAAGSADGSGGFGSEGAYTITASAPTPLTLSAAGTGSFAVSQAGTLSFVFTSNGAWGYPAGQVLLQGSLQLSSLTTTSATAGAMAGWLTVSGGALAGAYPSAAGQVTLPLALGGSLQALVGTAAGVGGEIASPGSINPGTPPAGAGGGSSTLAAPAGIVLGSSSVSLSFAGTGGPAINLVLNGAGSVLAAGSASGAGAFGSEGSYSITASTAMPLSLTASGNGNYAVSQTAPLAFTYTSTGAWGYAAGTVLLQGSLQFSSVAAPTPAATALAALTVTGGALAGDYPAGGAVTLSLSLGGSLPALIGATSSITGQVSYPGNIAPAASPPPAAAPAAGDVYGGDGGVACPAGPAAHFYAAKLNANPGGRWVLCTPAGHAFWLKGVYDADASDSSADYQGVTLNGAACSSLAPPSPLHPCSVIEEKYGDVDVSWGPRTVARLKAWGFNAAAEYASLYVLPTTTNASWSTSDHSNPEKIAFTGLLWPSHYARNANPYANPVKDLVAPVKASVYGGYRHPAPDVFDPNFGLWLQRDLADPGEAAYHWIHSAHSDYLIGLNVDDADELLGFGAGPDFATLSDGAPDGGTGRWEPNLAWLILATPPTQTAGTDANGNPITYSDATVYSKRELSNWLSARYNGDLAALNAAWGSAYTSFGSAGGWGTGTGLLDEDGAHAWVPRDPYRLAGATAAMQADLNAFLLHFATQYFSVIKAALQAAAPGILYLGPTSIGGWGAPPRREILEAAAAQVDVLSLATVPTGCTACSDDQARADFVAQYGGDKPWLEWEGFTAQPDSYMAAFAAPSTGSPQSATQAARGAQFQAMVQQLLASQDSAGATHHVVGYKWWALYDSRGEQANWGLLTRRDNAYDGSGAVMALGTDAWGFATGGELANYGDFLGAVTAANALADSTLAGLP